MRQERREGWTGSGRRERCVQVCHANLDTVDTTQNVGRITMAGNVRMFDPNPHASPSYRISLGGITSGPDGALWFSTANVAVGRVTTSGAFTLYPFPPNSCKKYRRSIDRLLF